MYLRDLFIKNSGPVSQLAIRLSFTEDDKPVPHVLVGRNGGGKTNLLSLAADALIEGASSAYQDIVEGSTPVYRKWFRVVGSKTVTHGTSGGFSIMRFSQGASSFFYKEKAGDLPVQQAISIAPPVLHPAIAWEPVGHTKEFNVPDKEARTIFSEGAYAYFPSSRAEHPFWLNREAIFEPRFDTEHKYASRLRKPLFVEKGVDAFAQWLMSVIVEARVDVSELLRITSQGSILGSPLVGSLAQELQLAARSLSTYQLANRMLQIILGDPDARFVWGGRHYADKIAVQSGNRVIAPGLDGLSGGQASLLSIFGTLLRYGDSAGARPDVDAAEIEGICIVDEIDAHMHVDLQVDAIPRLIAMFPRVQFLISAHSPLFAMGMERHLGTGGVRFIEMPSGNAVSAEAYQEFEKALNAFKDTRAFDQAVETVAGASSKPKVWLEGETDPLYLRAAAEALGFSDLLARVDFDWIGAKDPGSGQGMNTGKDALDKALALLMAKPEIISHPLILLYDSDADKQRLDRDWLHVRSLPFNGENKIARKGVENLLPESVFTDDVYSVIERPRDYGGTVTTRSLDKMKLCRKICQAPEPDIFEKFRETLEEMERLTR